MQFKKEIKGNLKSLGIAEGDIILLHSSLNSIGRFEQRAKILIDAFIEILGEEGTLLLPALSYEFVTKANPVFNVLKTKSCVGGLTEFFRMLPSTVRSLHPTHSVCGIGKHVDYLLNDHCKDNTPVGINAPFSKLKEIGGKVMFLGCGIKPNTSMHGVEEKVVPPYLFEEEMDYTLVLNDGSRYTKKYIPHNFEGYEQRYDRLLDLLTKSDYVIGNVLKAECTVIRSESIWDAAYKALKSDPLFFVDKI